MADAVHAHRDASPGGGISRAFAGRGVFSASLSFLAVALLRGVAFVLGPEFFDAFCSPWSCLPVAVQQRERLARLHRLSRGRAKALPGSTPPR